MTPRANAVASAPTEFTGFRPAAQKFFRSLARHNRKDWFEANRPVFEHEVRAPMKALVEAVDVALARVIPEIVGDPKRSLFRIHRDVRFSRDKSPYKTNQGCWFYHRDAGRGVGQDAEGGGAGFYFHLDGTSSFLAGGIWMPARPVLAKIRDALVDDLEGFEAIVNGAAFKRRFGALDPESRLTRTPRGYPADHPAASWLRFQSFTVAVPIPNGELGSAALVKRIAGDCARMAPFIRWLNRAQGLQPAPTRL